MPPRTSELQRTVDARAPEIDDPAELRRRLVAAEANAANLEIALISNRRIGMAIGILMTRHRLTEEQAFDLLREHSSWRNVKLVTLAEDVVYTGDLGPIPLRRQRHGTKRAAVRATA